MLCAKVDEDTECVADEGSALLWREGEGDPRWVLSGIGVGTIQDCAEAPYSYVDLAQHRTFVNSGGIVYDQAQDYDDDGEDDVVDPDDDDDDEDGAVSASAGTLIAVLPAALACRAL